MAHDIIAIAQRLTEEGVLGVSALRFGSPDRAMLVSAGPASHLARWSLLSGPTTQRVTVRQPSRETMPSAQPHSPLAGEIRLVEEKPLLQAEVEEWKHGSWYHSVTLRATDLGDLMKKLRAQTPTDPFLHPHTSSFPEAPFWCGGLAYDLVQWTQPLQLQHPPAEGALLAVLWCVTEGVVVENGTGEARVFGNDEVWCSKAEAAIAKQGHFEPLPEATHHREAVTHTDETHQDNIEAVRAGIVNGQVYQVNIGKHWQGEIDDPYTVFQRLLATNPAPYSAYVEAEDLGFALASSSPESLLTCQEGRLSTSPIKGTCPQGESDAEREALRNTMLQDQKERAEHRMLVDLMRNDLTRISQPGSVVVSRFDVEAYANVQHLVSHITSQLGEDVWSGEALQAVFPGGSITGCPRTMVCAVIDELEQMPRSYWTGSVGYIDVHSGACAWNILIRTLEAHRKGNQWMASVGAGGGITIASDPIKEVEEAAWKGSALRVAAGWMRNEHTRLPQASLSIHPIHAEASSTVPEAKGIIQTLNQALRQERPTGVLFVDNLDSFSLNIADAFAQLGHNVTMLEGRAPSMEPYVDPVALNDLLGRLQPSHIVLGPGPGRPDDGALTLALAHHALAGQLDVPVLGVCLGHQALAQADGWNVVAAPDGPVHGVPVLVEHDGTGLFGGVGSEGMVLTRYNSLVAERPSQAVLLTNATEKETGHVMGLQHPSLPIHGLQVHPESVGSPNGKMLLKAFLEIQSDG